MQQPAPNSGPQQHAAQHQARQHAQTQSKSRHQAQQTRTRELMTAASSWPLELPHRKFQPQPIRRTRRARHCQDAPRQELPEPEQRLDPGHDRVQNTQAKDPQPRRHPKNPNPGTQESQTRSSTSRRRPKKNRVAGIRHGMHARGHRRHRKLRSRAAYHHDARAARKK